MTAWIEVLTALTSGPDLPIRGTIREIAPKEEPEGGAFFATAGKLPVVVAVGDGCRVWRFGKKLRIEDGEGRPVFITDGVRGWDFSGRAERPRTGPIDRVRYFGEHQFLLERRPASEWAGDDFTQPAGPVEEVDFTGRRCWTVELAPPPHKPMPLRIWVDIESGQMLGYRAEQAGVGAQFENPVIGEEIDDAVFTWAGPVLTMEEYEREQRDRREAERAAQIARFSELVGASSLDTRVRVDFAPETVHFRESGGFDAYNRYTMLSRRPRGSEAWTPSWGPVHYVWSTPGWDWAAAVIEHDLDEDALRTLQDSLHPGEPVDRQRRIEPPGRGWVR